MPDTTHFTLSPWIFPAIAAILGFVSAITLERFKNRMVYLKFKRNLFQVGTSTNHQFWGKVELLYNDRKTNHLSLITIEVKNDSNIDLENVNVDLWIDGDSQILAHQGNYIENGNLIFLEKDYEEKFNEIIELNEKDNLLKNTTPQHKTPIDLLDKIQFITSNLKLNLPVFNRNTSIRIQVLAENFKAKIPILSLSILHKSCKLIPDEDDIEKEKKQNKYVAAIWLILFSVGVAVIYWKFRNFSLSVVWTGFFGFLSLFASIYIYQLIRIIRRVWR